MGQPAARIGDMHTCPMATGPTPHGGGPLLPAGSPNVFIGGAPAARLNDLATCTGAVDQLTTGSATVQINSLAAVRLGDSTAHGGTVVQGCSTVLIG